MFIICVHVWSPAFTKKVWESWLRRTLNTTRPRSML